MFDELKVKLNTKFVKGVVSKILAKIIYKQTGYKVNVQLNEIELKIVDGEAHLHVDVDAKLSNEELKKIIKGVGLD